MTFQNRTILKSICFVCLYLVLVFGSISHQEHKQQKHPLILNSISDKKYNDTILVNQQRIVIDQFISRKEVKSLVDLLVLRQSIFRMQYNGTFNCGCDQILYEDSPTMNKSTTPHQMKLFKSLLKVTEEVSNYIETFFNKSVQLQACLTNVRRAVGYSNIQYFRNSNISRWTHGIHSDQCRLQWAKDKIVCDHSDPHIRSDRHYTAVLYLNEVEGGDLAFVDTPAPPNEEATESAEKSKVNIRREMVSNKGKEVLGPGQVLYDDFYITREGIFTVVPPTAGKLAIFTSGAENIHGVTEVLGAARYVIYLWYNRVD